MPTLSLSKWGKALRASQTTHTAARDTQAGTQHTANPTTDDSAVPSVNYSVSSGRGSLTYSLSRSFFYFDTSGNTGTISNARIRVKGSGTANSDVIVVKSTAFGGDGSANLDADDFGNVNFSTTYSSEFTSWAADGSNLDITLNSTAETDIQNNSAFICAIIQYDNDQQNVDPGAALTGGSGVKWSANADFALIFDETSDSGPTKVDKIGKYTKSQIATFDGFALSSIASINGVS